MAAAAFDLLAARRTVMRRNSVLTLLHLCSLLPSAASSSPSWSSPVRVPPPPPVGSLILPHSTSVCLSVWSKVQIQPPTHPHKSGSF